MKTSEKTTEVLNDLIQINNDRIVGYEKAAKETRIEDADLRSLFTDMAMESRGYINEMNKYVTREGEKPEEGTTFRGKIYRVWMDVKATFSGHDRKAILASCEFGEDAAQRAYHSALSSDAEMNPEVRQLIMDQKTRLQNSHDKIKELRDSQLA